MNNNSVLVQLLLLRVAQVTPIHSFRLNYKCWSMDSYLNCLSIVYLNCCWYSCSYLVELKKPDAWTKCHTKSWGKKWSQRTSCFPSLIPLLTITPISVSCCLYECIFCQLAIIPLNVTFHEGWAMEVFPRSIVVKVFAFILMYLFT